MTADASYSSHQQFAFRETAFRIGNLINLLLLLVAIALALAYGSWWVVVFVGLPSLLVPFWLHRTLGDHQLSRVAYGVSFMLFSALHIHQSMGLTEIHFGIFVLLAILIAFRDWLVILIAAAVIAVHHLLFMYLQASGAPVYLVPAENARLSIILIHAIYVVIEAAVLIVICRASFKEAQVSQAFIDITERLVQSDGSVLLTERVPEQESALLQRFNHVLETLHGSIGSVAKASAENGRAADRLLEQGDRLSQGMAEQQREVGRIAAASEEMTQNIAQTEHQAVSVLEVAQSAEKAANEGKGSVNKTRHSVDALAQILAESGKKVESMADSAKEIRSVLQVIDALAEQTNLLALNAAIEAARAGEAGRGFAVVADEVRSLASKTQGSTDQIEKSIERLTQTSRESVQAVNSCLEQISETQDYSEQSDRWLDEIATQSKQLGGAIQDITASLQQQSKASAEVTESTQFLSELSQTHEEQAQELLLVAKQVDEITERLNQQAHRFVHE